MTGGAGYIGSQTAKALAAAGFTPVILDNLSTGHRWAVRWGPLVELDLDDRAAVSQAVRAIAPQAVVHLAASAHVQESMADPGKYFRNNVVGSLNLLDAMVASGVRDIVFSSTCATYGVPERVPMGESTPQQPVSPYGESKLFVERMLAWYATAYGLRPVLLRYFNAAGADLDGELGPEHDPVTRLIPRALGAAAGRWPLDVFGTDHPTPDGTAVRDYVHVVDLADAHQRSLEHLLSGGAPFTANLGTGLGSSVREIVAAVERVSGRPVPVRETPRRAGDPPELVADPLAARRILGWGPRCSDLDTIIRTGWSWQTRC